MYWCIKGIERPGYYSPLLIVFQPERSLSLPSQVICYRCCCTFIRPKQQQILYSAAARGRYRRKMVGVDSLGKVSRCWLTFPVWCLFRTLQPQSRPEIQLTPSPHLTFILLCCLLWVWVLRYHMWVLRYHICDFVFVSGLF